MTKVFKKGLVLLLLAVFLIAGCNYQQTTTTSQVDSGNNAPEYRGELYEKKEPGGEMNL